MSTLPHIEQAVQNILTTRAKELERETGFVQRSTAQLDGPAFAQTVVFGWMSLPEARRRGERPGRPQGSILFK